MMLQYKNLFSFATPRRVVTLACVAISLTLFASCKYNNPGEPQGKSGATFVPQTHTIAQLKEMYRTGGATVGGPVVINAQVISDDYEGNIYKSIYLQDATGGIEFKAGLVGASLFYKRGEIVSLNCNALQLGQYGGTINIGLPTAADSRYETAYLSEQMTFQRLARKREKQELKIVDLTIPTLSPQYTHMLVRLKGVQFISSELFSTYADPLNKVNVSAVERTLEDADGNTIVLRSSSYARFAGLRVPEGSGEIVAILGYFNGKPQLLISNPQDLSFNQLRFPSKNN